MSECPHTDCKGPCSVDPCPECGWLCKNSTWTKRDGIHAIIQAGEDYRREVDGIIGQMKLYEAWKADHD